MSITSTFPGRHAAPSEPSDTTADNDLLVALESARAHGTARDRAHAEEAVVVRFLSVAASVAHRYRWRGVDADDLEQVARVGLVKAVRRWRSDRGQFLPYALPTVEGEVKRYFRDCGSTIRIPRTIYEMQPRVASALKELRQERRAEPSVAEIAERAGISCRDVEQVQAAVTACRPLTTDGPDSAVQLSSAEAERDMSMVELRTRLRSALEALDDRERKIVLLRFVWDQSQVQIAGALGLSQMQISRLLRGALAKLHTRVGEEDRPR